MTTFTELLTKIDSLLGQLTPTMDHRETFKNTLETIRDKVVKIQTDMMAGCREIDTAITELEQQIQICILSGQMKELLAKLPQTTPSV